MTKLNNGHSLPLVGLGTYSLKGQICIDAVYGAIRLGYRLIDTAHMYGNEREVGIAVRRAVADGLASREEIAVATKLYPDQYARPASAIEESLAKLDLGWCDIMRLHHPGRDDVSAYRAMEDHAGRGLIRSLGLSCFYQAELDAFLPQVRVKPVLVQNEIHPYYQDRQNTLHIQSQGIAVQAWYPLGGRGHQRELFADPVLQDIASRHGKTAAQVMLRWNVQNGVPTSVNVFYTNTAGLPGSTRIDLFDDTEKELELEDLWGALKHRFNAAEIVALQAIGYLAT